MSLIFASIPPKRLAAAITAASTSFYLNNIKGFDLLNSSDVSPSDLGTQHYCCFRNDTGTKIEIMEIDPSTLVAGGAITIVRRGLSYYGDRTTETSDLKLDWSANETIVQLGTDVPQIFQWLKEYIDAAAIAGAVPASTSTGGLVVEASQAEIDARTATKVIGASTYKLFATPDKIRASKYHDYAADAGSNDTYVITVTPAPTAYAAGQVFTFKANTANTDAATLNVNSLGAKTIKKGATSDLQTGDILASQIVTVVYDGTNFQLVSAGTVVPRFGGTGTDGALSITSGATNIDLGSAQVVTKNYTSISITGTGSLTFTNPHTNGTTIILKSQGAVTLTSSTTPMIDASGMGSAVAGNDAYSFGGLKVKGGTNGTNTTGGVGGALAVFSPANAITASIIYAGKYPFVCPGGGGGNSFNGISGNGGGGGGSIIGTGTTAGNTSSGTGATKAGGVGGGALIVECAGALNFTTANGISVGGKNGTNGASGGDGGGGGGGGGTCLIVYNTLTSASGTVVVSGGTGGTNSGAGTSGGGGATGVSMIVKNTEFL